MNFRRLFTAVALLALFAALASAQGPIGGGGTGGTALTCSATVSAPPQLRSEGITDLIGDIVISCTGGTPLAPNQLIPTVNITVSLQTNVTSRLTASDGTSEALLLINEPGSTLSGAIPTQTLCGTPSVGSGVGGTCQVVNVGGAYASCTALTGNTCTGTASTTNPTNMFQGIVSGNQVTFFGIPVNPPVTGSGQTIFRITNVRANINGLGGGGLAGTTPVLASIAISPFSGLPVNNPVQTVGFIQQGLKTSILKSNQSDTLDTGGTTFNQCVTTTRAFSAFLRYTEGFGTAFKTRTQPTATTNGQTPVAQNIPGTIYNSESGFIPTASSTIGLADFGTRLKAVFNNIPSGVRIFVSQSNVIGGVGGNNTTAVPANTVTPPLAVAVVNETTPDSNGMAPLVPATTSSGTVSLIELPVVNGSATAVWEVVQTNPSTIESFDFGVYVSFTANVGSNSPAVGTGTVNQSFAPTSTVLTASTSAPVPRFADTSSAKNFMNIVICQTTLLYPFVTNQAGFDTGIAIANTTTDVFGTGPQAGTCAMNFFGANAPAAAVSTGSVASGTVFTTLASVSAANFQGYMIAVCNFQYAHGFAFISDLGARNLAMGYLALIINNGTVPARGTAGENLNN